MTFTPTGKTFHWRALGLLDALSNRLGHKPNAAIASHLAIGLRGEEIAFFHLRELGYILIARRWKTPKFPGDVDLIGWDTDTLCFIEVKTRTGRTIVPAEFSVDQHKQKTLRSLASVFLKHFPETLRRHIPVRFDVVSVYLPVAGTNAEVEIEVLQAAFSRH